jgi:membrane protease YdiL (CAAX protease family)
MFLRKTWLAVPALVACALGIMTQTSLLVHPDGTPKRPELYDDLGAFYIVLFPLIVLALVFTRGRREFGTIAFGRLVWWQILLYGMVLGALAQLSGHIIYPLFGGAIVSANHDPNLIDAIVNVILVVFFTPIIEETIFRVVLQTYLQRYGTAIALVGTAAIFTLFHLPFFDRLPTHDDLVRLFALILIPALILSLARRYSGSLLLTLLIHSADNALGFLGPQDIQLPGCC